LPLSYGLLDALLNNVSDLRPAHLALTTIDAQVFHLTSTTASTQNRFIDHHLESSRQGNVPDTPALPLPTLLVTPALQN
jgi:hypothetical protein